LGISDNEVEGCWELEDDVGYKRVLTDKYEGGGAGSFGRLRQLGLFRSHSAFLLTNINIFLL
jgi:hypothetical protein